MEQDSRIVDDQNELNEDSLNSSEEDIEENAVDESADTAVDDVDAATDDDEINDTDTQDDSSEESDEDAKLDEVADVAIEILDSILQYFDLGETTIDEYEGDDGELILDITGDDLAILIGRHGRTLDALQFLVSSLTSRKLGYRFPVVVDVEGYKDRQRTKLEKIAYRAADKALEQDRNVKLHPMNPYERRLVHIALRDYDGVYTQSEGQGSSRHVVVFVDHDD